MRFRHRLHRDARFVYDRMRSDGGAPLATQAMARLRALTTFRECVVGARIYAYGPVRVVAEGSVILGSRVFFLGGMIPTEIKCFAGGVLRIDDDSGFNYGAAIEAHQRIDIGKRCMIASMVTICDSTADGTAPIVIGDGVWIAHGATIQPGAVIGNGSVVSAGSVVSGEIPPQSLALGNPARALKLDVVRTRGAKSE